MDFLEYFQSYTNNVICIFSPKRTILEDINKKNSFGTFVKFLQI